MGYASTLLAKKVEGQKASLLKGAKKKSLWGSIGRAVGSLGVMALTGGAVNPITLGLLTGGASFLGGAIGSKFSGVDLTEGKFFKSDRAAMEKELGAFGTQNIVSSLKSGITSGIGQASKLRADKLLGKGTGEAAKLSEGFGLDFEGSFVGKRLPKVKSAVTNLPPIVMKGDAPAYGGKFDTSFLDVPSKESTETYLHKDLWSKFKGKFSEGMKETGGEFSFKDFKNVGDYSKTALGTAQYRLKQGLEAGEQYGDQTDWGAVKEDLRRLKYSAYPENQ